MSQLRGQIEQLAQNKSGIKILDKWYDLAPNLQKLPLKVGTTITADLNNDNKTIRFIHFDDTGSVTAPPINPELPPVTEEHIFDEKTLTEIGRHLAEAWKLLQKL